MKSSRVSPCSPGRRPRPASPHGMTAPRTRAGRAGLSLRLQNQHEEYAVARHRVRVSLQAGEAAMALGSQSELKRFSQLKRGTCQKCCQGAPRCVSTWSLCFNFLTPLSLHYWYRRYDSWNVNAFPCLVLQAETAAAEQFFLVSFNQGLEFQRGKFGVVLLMLCNIPSCFVLLQCNCD